MSLKGAVVRCLVGAAILGLCCSISFSARFANPEATENFLLVTNIPPWIMIAPGALVGWALIASALVGVRYKR